MYIFTMFRYMLEIVIGSRRKLKLNDKHAANKLAHTIPRALRNVFDGFKGTSEDVIWTGLLEGWPLARLTPLFCLDCIPLRLFQQWFRHHRGNRDASLTEVS